jgi:hypothetical protein
MASTTRISLVDQIEYPRQEVADAAATASVRSSVVVYKTLTASRVLTLPSAKLYPKDTPLIIADESGNCSASVVVSVTAAANETILGLASVTLTRPFQRIVLYSNGNTNWSISGNADEVIANLIKNGPLATALSKKFDSVGGTLGGNLTFNNGNFIQYTYTKQQDTNDGKITARLAGPGLNIVGIATEPSDNTRYLTIYANVYATDALRCPSITSTNAFSTVNGTATGTFTIATANLGNVNVSGVINALGQNLISLAAITPTNGDITKRVEGGFYQYNLGTKALGWPADTNNWFHLISATHANPTQYYAMQIAGGFFDNQDFYIRKTNTNGNAAWNKIWHSGPYVVSNDTPFHSFTSSETGYTPSGGAGAFYIPRVVVHTMVNPVGHREMNHHEIHATGAQQGHFVVAANFIAWGHAAANNAPSSGSIFGLNAVGIADAGMSADAECSGAEINTLVRGNISRKTGLQIVDSPGSSGGGYVFDAGLLMGRGDSTAIGYYTGIQIGTNDANAWPVRANLMKTGVGSCQVGIDLQSTTFNSNQALLLAPNHRITWSQGTGGYIASNTAQNGPQIVFSNNYMTVNSGDNNTWAVFDINSAAIRPATDAAISLGTPGYRFGVVFCQTGQINTSSRLQKKELGRADDDLIDAIADIDLVQFQFLDSVAEKGDDNARIHSGVIAEQVRDALVAKNIDPSRYSFWCSDPLTETVLETYEVDEEVTETIEVDEQRVEFDDTGRAIMRTVKVETQRLVVESIPVFNEDGTPCMTKQRIYTDSGETQIEDRQVTISRNKTTKVVKTREVERPVLDASGKQVERLGVRYTDLLVLLTDLNQRRIKSQQDKIDALQEQINTLSQSR